MARSRSKQAVARKSPPLRYQPVRRPPIKLPALYKSPALNLYEDRRVFHPLGRVRPAFSLPKMAARIVADDRPNRRAPLSPFHHTKVPVGLKFDVPKRVAICVRRKRRKQVLHAKGVAGSRVRKPRKTEFSVIHC